MDDLIRVTVQYLHVLTGVLWIGGGLYTLTVATREVRRIGQNDAFSYGDLVWLR